jgi:hypothetical protein
VPVCRVAGREDLRAKASPLQHSPRAEEIELPVNHDGFDRVDNGLRRAGFAADGMRLIEVKGKLDRSQREIGAAGLR